MSEYPEINVNVDSMLALNKYNVDEGNPHIKLIDDSIPDEEFRKLVLACPAALYKVDSESNEKKFDYAGCLECGTCRVLCGDTILDYWKFPGPEMGVQYREG